MTRYRKFSEWVESYRNGFGRRPGADEAGPIVLRIADVSSGKIDLTEPRRGYVSPKEANTYKLQKGDLIFVRVNGTLGIVGSCCAVGADIPADTIFNDHLIRVRLKAGLDAEFARLCFGLPSARGLIEEAASTSAGQLTISQQVLDSIDIPFLSLDEQRNIVVRLEAQMAGVETARQAAKAQLRDAAALKKKALESLFTSIPNWAPIGYAAKLQSGYAFKSDNFKKSGVHLLRNANIRPGKVYWDDAVFLSECDSAKYPGYALSKGDVLISLDRPIISSGIKVARVDANDLPALLVQRVGRFLIDPQKLDADYLYAYLQTDLFISKISGHDQSLGVPHISPAQVEAIEIPLPEISVQRELSKQLNESPRVS